MRRPVFELHIQPMIRATDRAHMRNLFGDDFDLWDYEFVSSRAERILERLELDMPTPETGGPWPPEWILLFHRWITTGFKRLSLGVAEYEVFRHRTVIELQASGTFPTSGFRGWLQLETETESARTYVLYFDPPESPEAGPGEDFVVAEQYVAHSDGARLFVRDANGLTELAVPPAVAPSPT
jgi:hypothetical protein